MKKLFFILTASLAFSSLVAQDLGMDDVLKNHFETIGQDKILQIDNMVSKGTVKQMGMDLVYTTYITRSGKMYLEVPIQGMLMKRGFDGTVAWMTAPWTGSSDPIELGDFETRMMKTQLDIDGMLYKPESKGYKVDFLGKEDMEGTPVYLIKLTDTLDNTYTHYIDAENFVVLKVKGMLNYQGSQIESESFMSNYKPVEGIIMPFSMESKVNGQLQSSIIIEEYLFNQEINDSIFLKPAPQPKPETPPEK
jgi:hypothetical protein